MTKNELEKILRKRTVAKCQGTAAYAVGKRKDWSCQHIACVGGIFCKQHGGTTSTRYIRPADLPSLLEELSDALIPQEQEAIA